MNAYSLSELLYMPMPTLPTQSQKSDSINISSGGQGDSQDVIFSSGGRWEDEEERKFFEDIQDLRDFVPKSVLGIDEKDVVSETGEVAEDKEKERKDLEALEVKELEEELRRLEMDESTADGANESNVNPKQGEVDGDNVVDDDEYVAFFLTIYARRFDFLFLTD